MPKITIAQIENRIRESAPLTSRGDIRRAAKLHVRRFNAHTYIPSHEEALALVKAVNYTDTTGEQAVHNVLREAA